MALRGRSKYRNVPVTVDNYRFDSKAEAARYCELKLLQMGKEITDLAVHPRFPLEVKGERICVYELDFSFREKGRLVAVDVKGFETPEWKIKAKLFRVLYPDVDFRVESARLTAARMTGA